MQFSFSRNNSAKLQRETKARKEIHWKLLDTEKRNNRRLYNSQIIKSGFRPVPVHNTAVSPVLVGTCTYLDDCKLENNDIIIPHHRYFGLLKTSSYW